MIPPLVHLPESDIATASRNHACSALAAAELATVKQGRRTTMIQRIAIVAALIAALAANAQPTPASALPSLEKRTSGGKAELVWHSGRTFLLRLQTPEFAARLADANLPVLVENRPPQIEAAQARWVQEIRINHSGKTYRANYALTLVALVEEDRRRLEVACELKSREPLPFDLSIRQAGLIEGRAAGRGDPAATRRADWGLSNCAREADSGLLVLGKRLRADRSATGPAADRFAQKGRRRRHAFLCDRSLLWGAVSAGRNRRRAGRRIFGVRFLFPRFAYADLARDADRRVRRGSRRHRIAVQDLLSNHSQHQVGAFLDSRHPTELLRLHCEGGKSPGARSRRIGKADSGEAP